MFYHVIVLVIVLFSISNLVCEPFIDEYVHQFPFWSRLLLQSRNYFITIQILL